jgi:cytochrome c553
VASFIRTRPRCCTAASLALVVLLGTVLFILLATDATAGPFSSWFHRNCGPVPMVDDGPPLFEVGGEWHWIHSPDQEKVVVASLFNRYCIRCHGIDGRGVWDIPGVPDFTNKHWQDTRTDAMFARRIIEGRGAVMPTFRGTLSLEEAWAMARYIRTLVPGTEVSPPVLPVPKKLETPKK